MFLPTLLLPLIFPLLTTAQTDNDPPDLPVVSINITNTLKYQPISGFGITQSFNRASQIYSLPPQTRSKILSLLFDPTTGAGLTILRNTIGSSNSTSTSPNSMLSIEPSPSSPPTYIWNANDSSQLWLSQEAQKLGVKTIYASAWSAPWYMKSNENDADGGFLCGVRGTNCSSGDWRGRFAEYLVQYVKEYQDAGVNVTHLGFLNEPDSQYHSRNAPPSSPSMLSNGTQAFDFLQILSPALASANLSHMALICCDNTGWSISSSTLHEIQSQSGEQFLSAFSSHGYSSSPSTPFNTSLPVWQTEWSDTITPWTAVWDSATVMTDPDTGDVVSTGDATEADGLVWASRIQDGLVNSNISAFLGWMGAEVGTGGGSDMLIRLNINTNATSNPSSDYTISKRLWAYAQFSRYVKPGSRRIFANSTSSSDDIGVSAFESKDVGLSGVKGISVQVINKGWGNVTVSMKVQGAREGGVVLPLLTNEGTDLGSQEEIGVREGLVSAMVPARSLMTFVFS